MELVDKDVAALKQFMQDRWLTLGDVAELLITLCNDEGRPIEHVIETGKMYLARHK